MSTLFSNYQWIENWATIPSSPLGETNGRTHGIAVLRNGEIVVFHQADPAVLFYSPEGTLLRSWGNYPGAHGLTVVEEDGEERFWLVDEVTKRVVKTTLSGEVLQSLGPPEISTYLQGGNYIPTWVAVAEGRHGGNGDIWVSDGYGSSLVHRYNAAGHYLSTLDGTEGAGRFNCPHGLNLDTRSGEPEFCIADRGNRRFQVYGVDGTFRRTFGADVLHSPDVAIPMGNHLVVPELIAGLSILDGEDRLVTRIGFQENADTLAGWPNERSWVREGQFNSPHSAAVDAHGSIFVVEWITGGRITKLVRSE